VIASLSTVEDFAANNSEILAKYEIFKQLRSPKQVYKPNSVFV